MDFLQDITSAAKEATNMTPERSAALKVTCFGVSSDTWKGSALEACVTVCGRGQGEVCGDY